jgi:hypothetical protein
VDPIAGFRDDRVVRGQEQSLPALLHDALQQFKGAFGIRRIEIACGLVCQDHSRIVGQCAPDCDTLLFASRKMSAGSAQFVA